MDQTLEYLLSFLEDEFRSYPEVRVMVSPSTSTKRSPDLVQDYDPETSTLHRNRGVVVRTAKREYYFPSEWVEMKRYDQVQKLAGQIKEAL
ncbi:MAG: hypothetical protein AB1540_09965 [Bdellovibrionota bacterium]